jgi:hypothetical protein
MGFSLQRGLSLLSTILASHHHAIVARFQILNYFYNIQQQKYTVSDFPVPAAGMSLTKLSLVGNNLTRLVTSRLGPGISLTFFYNVVTLLQITQYYYLAAEPYTESWRQRASRQVGRLHVVKRQRRTYMGRVLAKLRVSISEMREILFESCKIFIGKQKGSATNIIIFLKLFHCKFVYKICCQ